ncbi:MAG: 1-acyl-sn-glycerol-3-phosphate acyltransferase [Gammaproteobacteria bacterium]
MSTAPPPRVVRVDTAGLLSQPSVSGALAELAREQGRPPAELEAYARECLGELAVYPQERWLRASVRLARFMLTRSYAPDIDVNSERLQALRPLAGRRPVVFLWSHKSHLDSFAFLKVMYDADFRPQPLSFAGINMAFAGFATLSRRSGAIFLRRSFADDGVYRIVLQAWLDRLVRAGAPLSWSIEGTRSRTGRLMPPRLGLLRWVSDACLRLGREDALFVPVSISYEQIAEMDDYVAMQRGLPKRRESLAWFIEYIRGMKEPAGRIQVCFGEPLALAERGSLPRSLSADGDADRDRTRDVAVEICRRIEEATPVNGPALACLLLLGAQGQALDADTLLSHAEAVLDSLSARSLPFRAALRVEPAAELRRALGALSRTGVVAAVAGGGRESWEIATGQELAAAYYANTIGHFLLAEALAELAFALAPPDTEDSPAAVTRAVIGLRRLLRGEFVFPNRDPLLSRSEDWLDSRYPGWRRAGAARTGPVARTTGSPACRGGVGGPGEKRAGRG